MDCLKTRIWSKSDRHPKKTTCFGGVGGGQQTASPAQQTRVKKNFNLLNTKIWDRVLIRFDYELGGGGGFRQPTCKSVAVELKEKSASVSSEKRWDKISGFGCPPITLCRWSLKRSTFTSIYVPPVKFKEVDTTWCLCQHHYHAAKKNQMLLLP